MTSPRPGQASADGRSSRFIPSGLLLQWHLTERCNLRCTHCYQEGNSDELPLAALLGILRQYRDLLESWRSSGRGIWGHITLTGGEPLIRGDLLDVLNVLTSYPSEYSFALLTNGTLIDERWARAIARLGPKFVQVSVEGDELTHDAVRGKGSYRKAAEALRLLKAERVPTMVSFTAHRANYRQFPAAVKLSRELGAARVWADRLIPQGSGAKMATLSHVESRELFQIMARCRHTHWWKRSRTEVSMSRALQFLVGGGRPYRCTAGATLLTVMSNGDLVPCRRMPAVVGNLLHDTLSDLYYGSQMLAGLRSPERIPDGCLSCFYARLCRGGLRCLSYAQTGDPFQGDPGCWRLQCQTRPEEHAR